MESCTGHSRKAQLVKQAENQSHVKSRVKWKASLTKELRFVFVRKKGEARWSSGFWGYGSLVWNPGSEFDEKVTGFVKNYRRVFDLACIDHRGTPEHPARTYTLEEVEGSVCVFEECLLDMAYNLENVYFATKELFNSWTSLVCVGVVFVWENEFLVLNSNHRGKPGPDHQRNVTAKAT